MFKRLIASLVCVTFIFSNLQYVRAQDFSVNQLPMPGKMISITPAFMPLTLKGMVIHSENALKFDFLMDTGHSNLKGNDLSVEALKIMKYFLTALTIPEDDLWVNLSPYEKGRIVQDNFGQTIMGRDLLAEDYVLKQLTASVIYPENTLGKQFWSEIYSKASQQLGTTQIPVNTFNKVWIVPDQAVVWEHEGKVIIVKSHLKVMLEADYLSASKHQILGLNNSKQISAADAMARDAVRKLVIPVLEKEVNTGKNFAQLRQMFQAMILATWYKKALRESILTKVYANQKKTKGVDGINAGDVESIYQQYLKAFKKGAFNYIKEDLDTTTGQSVPRKYFSGGFSLRNGLVTLATALLVWGATLTNVQAMDVNHALEGTGTTILVKGNITDVGPGASADVVKQFEQTSQPQTQTKDAAMINPFSFNGRAQTFYYSGGGHGNERIRSAEWFAKKNEKRGIPLLMGHLADEGRYEFRKAYLEALLKLGVSPADIIQVYKKTFNIHFSISDLTNTDHFTGVYGVEEIKLAQKMILSEFVDFVKNADPDTINTLFVAFNNLRFKKADVLNALLDIFNRYSNVTEAQNLVMSKSLTKNQILNFLAEARTIEELEKARKILNIVGVTNQENLLLILEKALENSNTDVRIWALRGLGDNGSEKSLDLIATRLMDPILADTARKILTGKTLSSRIAKAVAEYDVRAGLYLKQNEALRRNDYEAYNSASDALYALGDTKGNMIYKYILATTHIKHIPEQGHDEYNNPPKYDYSHLYPSGYVVDVPEHDETVVVPAHWELLPRDSAMLSAPTEHPEVLNEYPGKKRIDSERLISALNTGRVEMSAIEDAKLRNFMDFLNKKGLEGVVIFGGAVRDAILGKSVRDIDITVRVDLQKEDKTGAFTPATRLTYERSQAILAKLADAMGVSVQDFQTPGSRVMFQGVQIHYFGPAEIKRPQGDIFIKWVVFDKETGIVETSQTAPEILLMGMAPDGSLLGYRDALQHWIDGKAYLKGDLRRGKNLTQLSILKLLRLRHQFGMAITNRDLLLARQALEEERKTTVNLPELVKAEISKVLEEALDPKLAKKELSELGFPIDEAMSQAPDKAALAKVPDHLGGIALDAAMLDLQIKRDGNGVPLPISQQPLDKINIQGFVPQIISIQPVNLPALLGFNFQKEEALAKV